MLAHRETHLFTRHIFTSSQCRRCHILSNDTSCPTATQLAIYVQLISTVYEHAGTPLPRTETQGTISFFDPLSLSTLLPVTHLNYSRRFSLLSSWMHLTSTPVHTCRLLATLSPLPRSSTAPRHYRSRQPPPCRFVKRQSPDVSLATTSSPPSCRHSAKRQLPDPPCRRLNDNCPFLPFAAPSAVASPALLRRCTTQRQYRPPRGASRVATPGQARFTATLL